VRIEVSLLATFAAYAPPGSGTVRMEAPEGSTPEDLARALGIPESMARIVLVNGRDAEPGWPLVPGDVVTLFPPLAGG
jgi:hypothetical protein